MYCYEVASFWTRVEPTHMALNDLSSSSCDISIWFLFAIVERNFFNFFWKFFQHKKRKSYLQADMHRCNVVYYVNIPPMKCQTISLQCFCSPNIEQQHGLLCNHSNGDLLTCEDNNVTLFSHVMIPCFHVKAHLVFHWCIYNKDSYFFNNMSKETILLILT